MITTNYLLAGLIVVGIILILRELKRLSELLKSHFETTALDGILSRRCPKLYFDARWRSDLRTWYSNLESQMVTYVEGRDEFWRWTDRYNALYEQFESEKLSSRPYHASDRWSYGTALEVAASQGNKWACIVLVSHASAEFETERRKELGLTLVEAQYLLNAFWRQGAVSSLPLTTDEWNTEGILAYMLRTKWFAGIPPND